MGRDGAEGAAAEASAVDVDAELDHLVGRDALALVFGVRHAGVGQVERGINLRSGHRRIGRIDNDKVVAHCLYDAGGVHHIRLFLDVAEVLGLGALVAQALFVAVQHDVGGERREVRGEVDGLWNVLQ